MNRKRMPNRADFDSTYWLERRPVWMGNLIRWTFGYAWWPRLSCNEAARRCNVAISPAINWVRRKVETGSVAPGQMGTNPGRSAASARLGCRRGSSGAATHCGRCLLALVVDHERGAAPDVDVGDVGDQLRKLIGPRAGHSFGLCDEGLAHVRWNYSWLSFARPLRAGSLVCSNASF